MVRKLLLVLLFVSLGLTGCGFHLRGSPPFPEDARALYLKTSNNQLFDELAVYLRDSGATVMQTKDGADAVLNLGNESFNTRTLSVDPDTGKEREFELSYSVSFELRKSDGTILVEHQTVNLVRDYVFDNDQVIGKSREKGVLEIEMRRDAAQRILTRLAAALSES